MAATIAGTITTKKLMAAMPEKLTLKRGANARLFVQTPFGALMMNTKAGQKVLEENGDLQERDVPEPIAPPPAPEPQPEPASPAEPERKEEPEEKGFFGGFFD